MTKAMKQRAGRVTPTWKVVLGRNGLTVKAGRHLRVFVSLTLLSWVLGLAGFVSAGSYLRWLG
ncbi:hypothetical protein [Streptomyces sp. NPDC050534]|uniref:hypothetical protein n=1 Tax=Streptomyces sp. NPDC050534 TaxID=3365625 RepID=UPI0037B23587